MHRFKPTPTMVVSMLALVFAMTGTGLAAKSYIVSSSSQIKNGAVTGADVKNSSLTGADVKDKSLTAKDFNGSVQGAKGDAGVAGPAGPQGAKGDAGATGPAGATGAAGASGTALAYVHINTDGSVDAAQSKGVTGADVSHPAAGVYCIASPPAGAKTAIGTVGTNGTTAASADRIVNIGFVPTGSPGWSTCPAGSDRMRVSVVDASTGTLVDQDVRIWFDD